MVPNTPPPRMKPKTGRPPKHPTGTHSTLTIKLLAADKTLLIQMADAYDMTITEYLTTLLHRDA
jgi:hypothetical protein